MYTAATAKPRAAINGFSAGQITIQGTTLRVPVTVSDADGNVVATTDVTLRGDGQCTGLAHSALGEVGSVNVTNPDAAIGAIEAILAVFSKAARDPAGAEYAGAVAEELMTYLVTVNLIPR